MKRKNSRSLSYKVDGVSQNLYTQLDNALEQSIPHITNLVFIKEIIQQMKAQLDSYDAAEKFLDEIILKEQEPTKRTDLKIFHMFLTRDPLWHVQLL